MALRKEPERRYASVQELGEDLGRHLANRTVSARADTFGYRARKFLRRNRLAVTAVSSAVLLLLAMASYVAVSSSREARRTALEKQKTEQAMEYLVEVLKGADPAQTGRGPRSTLELLDDGTRQVSERFAGNPAMQATLLDAIGQVYTSFGYLQRAEPQLIRGLALRRELFEAGHPELVDSLVHLGDLHSEAGRPEPAITLYQEALDSLSTAGAEDRRQLHKIRQKLAEATMASGDLVTAEGIQRQALETLRGDAEADPLERIEAMRALGTTWRYASMFERSEAILREALELAETVLPEGHLGLADAQEDLGLTLFDTGLFDEAETLLRACLAAREQALDDGHPDLAQALNHLAIARSHQSHYDEAEELYLRSLRMVSNRLGPRHPETATAHHNLAMLRFLTGDIEAAEEGLREAFAILRETRGDHHPGTAKAMANLALALARLGRREEAKELYGIALPILQRTFGQEGLGIAEVQLQYGRYLMVSGDFEKAREVLETALQERQRSVDSDHWLVAESKGALGVCLANLGRHEEARALLEEARPRVLVHFGPRNWRILSIDHHLDAMAR